MQADIAGVLALGGDEVRRHFPSATNCEKFSTTCVEG